MTALSKMIKLYYEAIEGEIRERRRQDDIVLGILAGEPRRIFGRPVEFTLTWPEGRPFNYTEDQLRAMAADWLRDRRTG